MLLRLMVRGARKRLVGVLVPGVLAGGLLLGTLGWQAAALAAEPARIFLPLVRLPPAVATAAGATPTPTRTQAAATPTTGPGSPGSSFSLCGITNAAWTDTGKLLRGGTPSQSGIACLAQFGVDTIVDQRTPIEAGPNEPRWAATAGIEYINLGIPDDTAPSPAILAQWIETVNTHLADGKLVLVHDRAGRGRMGLWDAVYWMQNGLSPRLAIEDRYLGKGLSFQGAKIGCSDGGNGQVQALSEIGQILTGDTYFPSRDEYGTTWQSCPRPSYMNGWNYQSATGR